MTPMLDETASSQAILPDSGVPGLVIVLGMHRSGTSLIANLLANADFYAGAEDDLMQGNRWNRDGYFERWSIMRVDDSILELAGGNWRNPPEESRISRISIDFRIEELLCEYKGHPRAMIKDPRMCLTFPVWRPMLGENTRILFITRSSQSVSASLKKRDGILEEKGEELWKEYNLRAKKYIKEFPVFAIGYEDLFTSRRAQIMGELARFLDIEEDLEAIGNAIIDPALDHSRSAGRETAGGSEGWAQVFIPTAADYSEAASRSSCVGTGRWIHLVHRFRAGFQESPAPIRFDPFDKPALIEIAGLTLRSDTDGTILWRVRTPEELASVQVAGTAQRLNDKRLLRILSYGDDPQVLFPKLSGPQFSVPSRWEAWIRVEVGTPAFCKQMAEREENLASIEDKLREAQGQLAEKEQSIQALMAQLAEKEQCVQARSAQVVEFEDENRALIALNIKLAENAQQVTEGMVQVFLPTAAGYSEDASIRWQLRTGQWQRLTCTLEPHDNPDLLSIRMDPFDRQSVVEIAGIILRSAVDKSILWIARTPEIFQTLQVAGTAQLVPDVRVLKILCNGKDPQLYLPKLESAVMAQQLTLEFWLRVDVEKTAWK